LVNRALADDALDCRFTTLLFARLDPRNRSWQHVSASHATSYLLDARGLVKARLNSTGLPLGILPDIEYEAAPPLTLETGDVLLLLTDGVVEAHDTDENLFGAQRTLAIVRAHFDRPAREIVAQLFVAVRAFCGARAQ